MTVEVESVVRHFGGTAALEGVSLALKPGEFAALLGPSGSGKTTLLRILAGLDFPDAGHVRIGGEDVAGVPARRRGVGVVFQHYALFRHMTVADNVAFGLRVRPRRHRPRDDEIARRVASLLDLVQIPELAARYPDQVSGGQRQRVALARALAIEPQLLLLDEPFGALDAVIRKDVRRWIRGLHDRLGITSILVTHDQEEAMELADRIAVMDRGSILQFGTPRALLETPENAFVAGFVGEAARLDGVIRDGWLHFGDLPIEPLRIRAPDGPASAFARRRDVLVHRAAATGSGMEIVLLHEDQDATYAILRCGETTIDGVLADDGTPPERGDSCRVRIGKATVFTAEGRRLVARADPADAIVSSY